MYSPCKKGDLNKLMSLNEEILRRPNRSEYLLGIMDNYESFRNVATSMVDDSEMINATLPPNLMSINQSLTAIVIYCLCFVVSAIGNLTVFITLTCDRYRKSRISFRSRILICHLSVADLLVTFIMIPVEVGWRLTIQWVAGNFACKIFAFLRAFGLYLSSNILVCVSVDRYFAVVHPLRFKDARRRGKLMLILAWTCSAVFAIPQCFVFHVLSHPNDPDFKQCVTFDSGINNTAYTIFCVLAMYFIPLVIICWAYINILHEITNQSRDSSGQSEQTLVLQSSSNGTLGPSTKTNDGNRMRLRRSDMANIERARIRTLRMTITIVVVFIVCWTPYVIMVLWYMIHDESAVEVDPRLQDALFLMAVGNSCANPLVYGSYAVNLREVCFRCCLPYNNNNDKSQIEVRIVQPSPDAQSSKSAKKSPYINKFVP